ncbi:homeobox 12 [Actinidia rufa]|uniref:Homeobox-leucine zipper protein n=1 Tax=Actinidia rufa TaxID=165716 RepID=A0A7J0DZF7_9ERIC|nr:homeobox 12 [Actinidia rufa]
MESIRKSRNKNNRRFNDEQIKSLESIFEMESRPELQTKQLLADKLGLQPRQVAIWFQNRRARSKSKLIEQEYGILKSRYNTLASLSWTL